MKSMIKPEEILIYLKNKSTKEKKARAELNNKNNNILSTFSFQKIINSLNIDSLKNKNFIPNIDNNILLKKSNNNEKENIIQEKENFTSSNVLTLKEINYDKNFYSLFRKKNDINIEKIKKYLNIKKKKYNKGKGFCSYFLQPRSDYYLNALNQGIINSFISFYNDADKLYSNNINENSLNFNSFKIFNTKCPIFTIKMLNNCDSINFFSDKTNKTKFNIYEKCCRIFDEENKNKEKKNENNNFFLKGLNHDIKYDLENYLSDKIKLLEIGNKDDLLKFENKTFVNKYPFQFIKISDDKNIKIDTSNIITEKKLKNSFNEPRTMLPLFLNNMFDNNNIFNHFSFCQSKNLIESKKNLNFIFPKNIDRVKDLTTSKFYKNFQNSEDSYNILNGQYLLNPFQLSINNKELVKQTNNIIKLKKLDGNLLFDNKYKVKRKYLDVINNDEKNKKEEEKKLIIVNKKNLGKLINNYDEYLVVNDISEGFDFLFDFNICGKMFYSSEFMDEFTYNGYNNLVDLINKEYLYYSTFYIFLIDDEQLKRNENYSVNKIVNNINQMINNKFAFIINNDIFQLNVVVKIVSNSHLIKYEINNIYNELVINNINSAISIYNIKIFEKILNNVKQINNTNEKLYNIKTKFNTYEKYIYNSITDEKLKNEIKDIINCKYEKRNLF